MNKTPHLALLLCIGYPAFALAETATEFPEVSEYFIIVQANPEGARQVFEPINGFIENSSITLDGRTVSSFYRLEASFLGSTESGIFRTSGRGSAFATPEFNGFISFRSLLSITNLGDPYDVIVSRPGPDGNITARFSTANSTGITNAFDVNVFAGGSTEYNAFLTYRRLDTDFPYLRPTDPLTADEILSLPPPPDVFIREIFEPEEGTSTTEPAQTTGLGLSSGIPTFQEYGVDAPVFVSPFAVLPSAAQISTLQAEPSLASELVNGLLVLEVQENTFAGVTLAEEVAGTSEFDLFYLDDQQEIVSSILQAGVETAFGSNDVDTLYIKVMAPESELPALLSEFVLGLRFNDEGAALLTSGAFVVRSIPEPTSFIFLATAMLGLLGVQHRSKE